MDEHSEEIAKIQTAVWLADKLARFCREYLNAERDGKWRETGRIRSEIDKLVYSRDFSDAVELVGADYFYPDILRRILAMLTYNEADTIGEAVRMLGGEPAV